MKQIATAILLTAAASAALAGTEVVTYTYDGAGRLVTAVYQAGNTNAALHYRYDANGNRTNYLSIAGNDTSVDTDGDSLADLDELVYFGALGETAAGDTDDDGLDNSTELGFGSNPALADTDTDDADDYHEWVADTDPNNPSSRFAIATIVVSNAPASVSVIFPSSAARWYTLRARTNLCAGAWTNIAGQTQVQGSGGTDTLTDPSPAQRRYYDVEVLRP